MKYLRLMRVKHYLKNVLVFLPIVFAGALLKKNYLLTVLIGFVSFCILSSVVYIMNDIKDVDKDRMHLTKKYRPIASGEVEKKTAVILAIILLLLSIGINYLNAGELVGSWICLILYFGINFSYSVLKFKNIPLLDVVLLVLGFFLRVYYGSALTGVEISSSLYLVIISGAFFMGFGKRRNEIITCGKGDTRDVLNVYNKGFLDKSMYSCMTLAIVFYSLWCVEKNKTIINKIDYLWTVPIFIVIMLRYSMIVEGESEGDPTNVVLSDKVLIGLVLMMAFVLLIFIYIG